MICCDITFVEFNIKEKIHKNKNVKKIILFLAILFASFTVAKAQLAGDVSLKVQLKPFQKILIKSGQKVVNLVYDTPEKYLSGVKSLNEDHLNISSTSGFKVTVQSSDLTRAGGAPSETITASSIKVKVEIGSNNGLAGTTMNEVSLANTPVNLIEVSTGSLDKNFNITYTGSGTDAYVSKYSSDENPTVYNSTVTYTIAAN